MSKNKPARFSLSDQDRELLIKGLKTLFASKKPRLNNRYKTRW